MSRFLFIFSTLFLCFFPACKKSPGCQTNDPAPALAWQQPFSGIADRIMGPYVYGSNLYYAFDPGNPKIAVVRGQDGGLDFESGWDDLNSVDAFVQEGDYLYWTHQGNVKRCFLPAKEVELLGYIGNNPAGYNEGGVTPWEGLAAAIFHESTMSDRDYVIGVFDMASRQKLFQYQVDDNQTTTNLGDPALGRTAAGDTIVAFVETALRKLMVFNLSTRDTLGIDLPQDELYFPYLRNIHIRNGRIFLALRTRVFCFDAASGSEIWQRQEGTPSKVCTLRFWNDHLIFHSNAENLYALDQTNGQTIWKIEGADLPALTPAIRDNVLYYTTSGAKTDLIGVDLSDGCTRVRVEDLPGEFGGLVGITAEGYLLFETGTLHFAYAL